MHRPGDDRRLAAYCVIALLLTVCLPPCELIGEQYDGMVRIPAQRVIVGTSDQERQELAKRFDCHPTRLGDDLPRHEASLPAFWIDRSPVTNAQYGAFVEATGHARPSWWGRWNGAFPAECTDHPVTGVSGTDAVAYARWAGRRLPTAEEWEAAVGAPERSPFPWGSSWPGPVKLPPPARLFWELPETNPVGTGHCGRSATGVEDFAGQVLEWVADVRPHHGVQFQLMKGASWFHEDPLSFRTAAGWWAYEGWRSSCTGFRCALDGDQTPRPLPSPPAGSDKSTRAARVRHTGYQAAGLHACEYPVTLRRSKTTAPVVLNPQQTIGKPALAAATRNRERESNRLIQSMSRRLGGSGKTAGLTDGWAANARDRRLTFALAGGSASKPTNVLSVAAARRQLEGGPADGPLTLSAGGGTSRFLSIAVPRFGHETFALSTPETIIWNDESVMTWRKTPEMTWQTRTAQRATYEMRFDELRLNAEFLAGEDCVEQRFTATNLTDKPATFMTSSCFSLQTHPMFYDCEQLRTYVLTADGRFTPLRRLSRGGNCVRWITGPTGRELGEPLRWAVLAVVSRDGRRVIATGRADNAVGFSIATNAMFTCLHTDSTVRVQPRGRTTTRQFLWFLEGTLDDLLPRSRRDLALP